MSINKLQKTLYNIDLFFHIEIIKKALAKWRRSVIMFFVIRHAIQYMLKDNNNYYNTSLVFKLFPIITHEVYRHLVILPSPLKVIPNYITLYVYGLIGIVIQLKTKSLFHETP